MRSPTAGLRRTARFSAPCGTLTVEEAGEPTDGEPTDGEPTDDEPTDGDGGGLGIGLLALIGLAAALAVGGG